MAVFIQTSNGLGQPQRQLIYPVLRRFQQVSSTRNWEILLSIQPQLILVYIIIGSIRGRPTIHREYLSYETLHGRIPLLDNTCNLSQTSDIDLGSHDNNLGVLRRVYDSVPVLFARAMEDSWQPMHR